MLANKGNIYSDGHGNLNNTGNGNNFKFEYYFNPIKRLNRTYLYDFCVKFAEIEDGNENYNTAVTSDIEEKMNYNEINLYKEIFLECDHYFDDVELILQEIPNRQRILSKIEFQYKRFKNFDKWKNKDELCEKVYRSLLETIENDQNSSNIIIEDAEIAIHALMYYAFVKCKLLDPVPNS
jgi:phage pi2 protein 07